MCSLVFALLLPVGLLAQDPASALPGATVIGVVTDWTSRAPLVAADVFLIGTGRRSASDAQGRFFLRDVPIGTHVFRITRLGYVTQDVEVTVTNLMSPVDIRLFPSPISIEGVTVTGNARAALAGIVLDAYTGDRLPWAALELTRNITQRVGRPFSADDQGEFEIDDLQPGAYLILARRLGYESQYLPVSHSVPSLPIVVHLRPDTALLRKVELVKTNLRAQVNASGYSSFSVAEERLRLSAARDFCQFLGEVHAPNGVSRAEYDDGLGPQDCLAYSTAEIYQVNVFTCGWLDSGPAMEGRARRRKGSVLRIYTIEYMERQANRPRAATPVIC